MIKVTESEFKKMQPGINRVLVIPETDNHVDSVTGIQVVRDESEREQGVIIAVSEEAKDAGYKKGDHIVYAKTSMEVFVCEVTSGDSVTEQRLRVIDWHDIAIKI
jgi:hypothetical protein